MDLVKIKMHLEIPENTVFSYQKASLMQGVLMEWLDSDYVETLHADGWKPYAQYLETIQGQWFWNITLFSREAYEKIYNAVMDEKRTAIYLKHDQTEIKILEKEVKCTNTETLMKQFYFQDAPKYIKIRFVTPTAFKKNGQYVFYPDISCILQSMIHKYDAVTTCTGEIDEAILSELIKNIKVIQYNLKSCSFHLEGIRIPAYRGVITLGLRGSQTLINYIHFLFHFACYCGIGIKTAMGMGAIEIEEKK